LRTSAGHRFTVFWQRHKENLSRDRIAVIGSEEPVNYECLNKGNCNFISNQKETLKKAKKLGFNVSTVIRGKFDTIILETTKNTEHNLALFALAESTLIHHGSLILNGENSLGVQSFLKRINYYWNYSDLLIKRRGRIAIFIKKNSLSMQIKHWHHLSKIKLNKDGYYTSPDMFSPKKVDNGSRKLTIAFKNKLHGRVADLGAGWGYLSKEALKKNCNIRKITLFEQNFSAIKAAKLNLLDDRATFKWMDIKSLKNLKTKFDHVICNPPFHIGQKKSIELLKLFIDCSSHVIGKTGCVWMVFITEINIDNYIFNAFKNSKIVSKDKNYKVYEMSKTIKKRT